MVSNHNTEIAHWNTVTIVTCLHRADLLEIALLFLVGVKDLQELLVDLRLALESVLGKHEGNL